jgi:hypothetical protein
MTVSRGPVVDHGQVIRLVPPVAWMRSPDTITLRDAGGASVDQTPQLADDASDEQIWFRDAHGTWTFGRTRFDQTVRDRTLQASKPADCP